MAGLASPSDPIGEPSLSGPGQTAGLRTISPSEAVSPAMHADDRSRRVEARPEQREEQRRQIRAGRDAEGQADEHRHVEPGAAGDRDDDREDADAERRHLGHDDLLVLGVVPLADHVRPQVVRHRAGGGDDEAGDDRQDRGQRDGRDDREEELTAGRAVAAAEMLRQHRDGQVAGLAGRLLAARAEDRARADADDHDHDEERADQEDGPADGAARRLRVGNREEAHEDVREPRRAEQEREPERDQLELRRELQPGLQEGAALGMVLGRGAEHARPG